MHKDEFIGDGARNHSKNELLDVILRSPNVLESVKTRTFTTVIYEDGTEFELATTKQLAKFFGVDAVVIQMLTKRHRDEFEPDGMKVLLRDAVLTEISRNLHGVSYVKDKQITRVIFEDGTEYEVTNARQTVYPKRAILRVAMLLRDSERSSDAALR